ncbi:hypothetical protein L210DRAFT_2329720 [Boletus edulis BED1]|uniref:F-box domain-containing protein n=1 Tax=Boletus edulis BED1 TaxID=1328754 RepID=A0AAD4BRG2_BOLED|nr:hypothetical protein L210DRAFT_2329720 [Boletus edulis BED1]
MARTSKRAKTTASTSTVTPDGAPSSSMSAQPLPSNPFQTGPNLERIPDDVLHETLSYLPTLRDHHVLFGYNLTPPVIPSTLLVRSSTLRALSQTSRLLRSRCLAMAWQRIELCAAKQNVSFYRAIGEATRTGTRVLKACPHLLPLIQTVSVVLTRYQSAEIIPAFAACLATLPNLTTIQVIHAHSQMTTVIKNGFEGKQFPSVRRISLPPSAHEIIKSCPHLEEVTCTEGDGSTIIGSLIKGKCQELRVIKGVDAPLKRLVKVVPNLRHIGVRMEANMTPLTDFPFLDTIELIDNDNFGSQVAASYIGQASEVLKQNKSQAEKTVLLTKWTDTWHCGPYENDKAFVTRQVIKV